MPGAHLTLAFRTSGQLIAAAQGIALGGVTTGGATAGCISAATMIAGFTAAVPFIATALLVGSVCVAGAVIISGVSNSNPDIYDTDLLLIVLAGQTVDSQRKTSPLQTDEKMGEISSGLSSDVASSDIATDTPKGETDEAPQIRDESKDVTLEKDTKVNSPQEPTRTNSGNKSATQSTIQGLGVQKAEEGQAESESVHTSRAQPVSEENSIAIEEVEREARRGNELEATDEQEHLDAEELERQRIAQEKAEEQTRTDIATAIGMTAALNMPSFSAVLFGTSQSDQNRSSARERPLKLETVINP
ncbi:hypothetical protein M408DRAFT_31096 [Serendipita vermifera MAFF 305830]|uniref:Uncharacterized protein n=1 Tax=Serendipita vermifera MAFF 305830 TaxID=933852 RepID=A0A0C2VZ86_SERVB|nr:hypothetical protein M408DRAFT_31096 [Serendipita vermifera MAFF 305830]